MLLDIINLDKLRRGILYAVIMVVTLGVQEMVLSRFSVFGIRAMILPLFPAAVGFLQGGMWALWFGLACGMLADGMFAETLVFFTVLFPVIAFLSVAADKYFLSRGLMAFCCLGVFMLLFTALAQALRVIVLYDASFAATVKTAALQTVLSVPFIFPVYYSCRALSERTLD